MMVCASDFAQGWTLLLAFSFQFQALGFRSTRSQSSTWASLPRDLLISVIRKAWKLAPNTIQAIQLVCKSWREALLELSAIVNSADVCIQSQTHLSQVCQMLPNLSSLSIREDVDFSLLDLDPLSACSRLSSLSLQNDGPSGGWAVVDMGLLPRGLRQLKINSFEIEANRFDFTRCVHLTSLTLVWFNTPEQDFHPLLERWQTLKVDLLELCSNSLLLLGTQMACTESNIIVRYLAGSTGGAVNGGGVEWL